MKNTNKKNTNFDNALEEAISTFGELFEFLWACGKLALIIYVIYRITVILGIYPPEG